MFMSHVCKKPKMFLPWGTLVLISDRPDIITYCFTSIQAISNASDRSPHALNYVTSRFIFSTVKQKIERLESATILITFESNLSNASPATILITFESNLSNASILLYLRMPSIIGIQIRLTLTLATQTRQIILSSRPQDSQ